MMYRNSYDEDWLLGLSDIENPFEDAEKYKAIKALIQNE